MPPVVKRKFAKLSKQVFELDAAGGLLVAVFDDDGAVEVHAALEGLAAADDGLGAGDDATTAPRGTTTRPSALRRMNSPVVASKMAVEEVMITPEATTAPSWTMVPS